MKSKELQHWGIKGQKWGVRRYQNKDGSLTPEGKKRYGRNADDSYDPTSNITDADVERARKKQHSYLAPYTDKNATAKEKIAYRRAYDKMIKRAYQGEHDHADMKEYAKVSEWLIRKYFNTNVKVNELYGDLDPVKQEINAFLTDLENTKL